MAAKIDPRVVQALERYFRECGGGPKDTDPRTADFCFHMTDWVDDLRALHSLYERPHAATTEEWQEALSAFLLHASGHILAAAKLSGHEPVDFHTPAAPHRQHAVKS